MKINATMRRYTIYHDGILKENEIATTLLNFDYCTTKQLDSCQAWIITYYDSDNNKIATMLQSYNTLVACYIHKTGNIYCSGTYSRTTRNHIGRFARYLPKNFNYYDFKSVTKHYGD